MPVVVILIVNLIPLLGVIFLRWSGGVIASLYALETVFIGIMNIVKMVMCQQPTDQSKVKLWVEKAFYIPFFMVHYGIFTLGQGSIIIGMSFAIEKGNLQRPYFWHFFFVSLLSVLIGQCFVFWRDFLKPKAYLSTPLSVLMFQPYSRVMLQQAVAIFGMFMLLVLKWHLGMAILLIVLKTLLELSQNKPANTQTL